MENEALAPGALPEDQIQKHSQAVELLPAKTPGVDTALETSERGLAPKNAQELWRLATFVAQSGLAPKGLSRPEQVLVVMQTGMELGMSPMRALQSFSYVNGRVTIMGQSALGLLQARGIKIEPTYEGVPYHDDFCAVATSPAGVTKFSVTDAKKANLWGKAGPWQEYPKRMLWWRAVGNHVADHYSAAMLGFPIQEATAGGPTVARELVLPSQPRPITKDPLFADEDFEPAPEDETTEPLG